MSYRAELTLPFKDGRSFGLSIYDETMANEVFEAFIDYAEKYKLPPPQLHQEQMVRVK